MNHQRAPPYPFAEIYPVLKLASEMLATTQKDRIGSI